MNTAIAEPVANGPMVHGNRTEPARGVGEKTVETDGLAKVHVALLCARKYTLCSAGLPMPAKRNVTTFYQLIVGACRYTAPSTLCPPPLSSRKSVSSLMG